MVAIGSFATVATATAKVCLVVCAAAFHSMGCAATAPGNPRPADQMNQTGGLLADQSKVIGHAEAPPVPLGSPPTPPAVYAYDVKPRRVRGSFTWTESLRNYKARELDMYIGSYACDSFRTNFARGG